MSDRHNSMERSLGPYRDEEVGYDLDISSEGTSIPWIDIHQHTHTLSWNDREKLDIAGAKATVAVAANYHYIPYRPVDSRDVLFLWDDALKRTSAINRSHVYDQYLAVGIRTWLSRVEDYEELLSALPRYAAMDEVVAIGEIGFNLDQFAHKWGLDTQRELLEAQLRIAADEGLPAIIHTPSPFDGKVSDRWFYAEHGHANRVPAIRDDDDDERAMATRLTIEAADEAGFPESDLVLDHMDGEIAREVLSTTDCSVSFSVGYQRRSDSKNVDTETIVEIISEFGSDRVLIDSDIAGCLNCDVFAFKRTMLEFLRLGLSTAEVKQIVHDNPADLLDL